MSKQTRFFIEVRIFLIFAAVVLSYFVAERMGFADLAFVNAFMALMALSPALCLNMTPYGHGVSGRMHIMSMPVSIALYYFLILSLLILVGTDSGTLLPETNARLRSLSYSIFFGWFAGVVDWYLLSYKETYYFSEYLERAKLKRRGLPDTEIDMLIEKNKQKGAFGPPRKIPDDKGGMA